MHGEAPHNGPVIRQAGEAGLLVEFGETLDDRVNDAAHAFDRRLREEPFAGLIETAPTIRSVLVRFDPLVIAPDAVRNRLSDLYNERDWLAAGPPHNRSLWRVPVLYGGAQGPDLDSVADSLALDPDAAIQAHAAVRQRVYMLGFAPGFAYLGRLPDVWNLPRLTTIKPEVPPGSLCIAVRQTALCATAIPTGWHWIGQTPFRSFAIDRDPPFLIEPGDEVVFEPVDAALYARLCDAAARGRPVGSREILP